MFQKFYEWSFGVVEFWNEGLEWKRFGVKSFGMEFWSNGVFGMDEWLDG